MLHNSICYLGNAGVGLKVTKKSVNQNVKKTKYFKLGGLVEQK